MMGRKLYYIYTYSLLKIIAFHFNADFYESTFALDEFTFKINGLWAIVTRITLEQVAYSSNI